jgi:hypothetical protein
VRSPSTNITIVNNSSTDICNLFIDLSAGPWTVDRLIPNDKIQIGTDVTLSFPIGEYDFRAEDCNGAQIAILFNQQVTNPFTWNVP